MTTGENRQLHSLAPRAKRPREAERRGRECSQSTPTGFEASLGGNLGRRGKLHLYSSRDPDNPSTHRTRSTTVQATRHGMPSRTMRTGRLGLERIDWMSALPAFPELSHGRRRVAPRAGKPLRRGSFAKRDKACACFSPLQQFISMNAERAPYQTDRVHSTRPMKPATPTRPMIAATIRLRASPDNIPEHGRKNLPAIQG